METNPASADICQSCGRHLPADHSCLHCAMELALEAATESPESAADLPAADAGFAAFSDPVLPQQAGRFTLTALLGIGGMGTVYEAEDSGLRRTVALKMIRGYHFSTEEEVLRFRREAEVAARLDHPHIVPVYEVGEMEGCPFLAMKLVRGGTLADRLKEGRLSAEASARLMAKVASAVAHAHEKGVLHRDLKPSNILVDEHGEPWLTDFGMARLAGGGAALTVTGAQIGTPQYMSPEQAAGVVSGLTPASDVWALGAMFYQMLSGRAPYEGESNVAIMHEVVSAQPPRFAPASGRERDLAVLVERCLQKDPSERLPGAALLAEELERWLRGEPIRSRPISILERSWRRARRHPAAVAGVAAVVLAAGLLVMCWPSPPPPTEPVVGVEISYQGTELHVRSVGGQHDDIRLREYTAGLLEVLTNDQTLRMPDGTTLLRLSRPIPLEGITRIVVDTGAGNDEVHVGGFHGEFPALRINGGSGGDVVNFGGRLVLAPGADLDLDLQDDAAPLDNDGVQFNGGSSTVVTGTGCLLARCSGRIWIGPGAQVLTEDGALTLEANQQEPANTGPMKGVEMHNAFAGSNGKGQVSVKGRGGATGDFMFGLSLKGGSMIQGGTEGVTTMTGTGGGSVKNDNSGICLEDDGCLMTTLGADLVVSGTGGAGPGSASNNGIAIVGGRIEGGGKQTTVTGRGGPVGADSHGVLLRGPAVRVAGTGAVSVTGYGGAESSGTANGAGVVVESGAAIKSRRAGPVDVAGQAGGSGQPGVVLHGGTITSGGGDIHVTARGSGGDTADLLARLPGGIQPPPSGAKIMVEAQRRDCETGSVRAE